MKRGLTLFWKLYMFFFAVPFPMILYYSINSGLGTMGTEDKNPWFALGILAASAIAWFILLIGYFRSWVLLIFVTKRNIETIKAEGICREAKILSAVKIVSPGPGYESYDLSLSFKNLADTEIIQKTSVNDSKPHERRYEVGKKVDLVIDKELKHIPYFIFAGAEVSIKTTRLAFIIIGWVLLFAIVVAYYIFSYQYESHGTGWRFLSFGHPLLICPVVLLFYRYIGGLIFNRIGGTSLGEAILIKFKGVKTTAKMINANQTGTYINEQPMIRFELEYTDSMQQVRRASLKKIVNLLDLSITKQETVDIFYLKDQPERIAFASDLNEIS
ncbi:MAG TPA: hypothetical protein VK541_24525 [Pedobacter sp.]|uniref:hypothetical protein n=1 Tax=Pedobacter sp. TaxID=1411316 RepID=UPI002B593175|nr:hypothetical protein [Pedobacter sp.]HMI05676.1 hypothetical protein [Pedobacter sp.]